MSPYALLGGAIGAVLLFGGAYVTGRADGKAIEVGAQARADKAVEKERAAHQLIVDQLNTGGQEQETARATSVREIFHETRTVTERPVYRNVCVDTDGVRLLDKAWGVANGEHPVEPAGPSGETPGAAAVVGR